MPSPSPFVLRWTVFLFQFRSPLAKRTFLLLILTSNEFVPLFLPTKKGRLCQVILQNRITSTISRNAPEKMQQLPIVFWTFNPLGKVIVASNDKDSWDLCLNNVIKWNCSKSWVQSGNFPIRIQACLCSQKFLSKIGGRSFRQGPIAACLRGLILSFFFFACLLLCIPVVAYQDKVTTTAKSRHKTWGWGKMWILCCDMFCNN